LTSKRIVGVPITSPHNNICFAYIANGISHASAEAAVRRILPLLKSEPLAGSLWIVEDHRVRIHP